MEASTHNPSSQFISELGCLPQFKPIRLRRSTCEDLFPTLVHQAGTAPLLLWHPLLHCAYAPVSSFPEAILLIF